MKKKKAPEIIIGIDPGTRVTGYGIIRQQGSSYVALDYGCIAPPVKVKLSERYLIIFNALEIILERYKPEALVVEAQYIGKNVKSILTLGLARGMAIIAAKLKGIAVYEYSPTSVKKAIGTGRASKSQVQELVKMLLNLQVLPPADAADALAVAICHSNSVRYSGSFDREI